MVVATIRKDQEKLAIGAGRHGRPTLVILGFDADGFDVGHLDLRCGKTELKSGGSHGENGTKFFTKLGHGKDLRVVGWIDRLSV